jgi:hypothetical protein
MECHLDLLPPIWGKVLLLLQTLGMECHLDLLGNTECHLDLRDKCFLCGKCGNTISQLIKDNKISFNFFITFSLLSTTVKVFVSHKADHAKAPPLWTQVEADFLDEKVDMKICNDQQILITNQIVSLSYGRKTDI